MSVIPLVIVQIVVFVAIVFALRKILYSTFFMETKRLQKLNKENAEKAKELAKKMEETDKQCRENIMTAEEKAKALDYRAEQEAQKSTEKILNEAKQESEHIIKQALDTKKDIRKEIEAEMIPRSVEFARRLVKEILSSGSQKALHEGIVDEVLAEIEKIEKGTLHIPDSVVEAEIKSPYAIRPAHRERLARILSSNIGRKITVQEVRDKNVIAGIEIKLGSIVIDGSLAGRSKDAAEAISK